MMRLFFRPLLIAIAVAILARVMLVQVFAIPSGSMSPTLQPGDQIVVTPYQLPWAAREPRRGDIVVFRRLDGTPGFFVKRIIGVPGDHLEVRAGRMLIDGHALPEPYLRPEVRAEEMAPEIVPADSYFVMGDHRQDSIDSRAWGFVPRSTILGRARLVFWSATGESTHQSADASAATRGMQQRAGRIRWERVLTPVR